MRNGADHAIFINTGQEFDGSDSGARPDEAISWGKIRLTAKPVKVYAEATLVFPLLVASTFAKGGPTRDPASVVDVTGPLEHDNEAIAVAARAASAAIEDRRHKAEQARSERASKE